MGSITYFFLSTEADHKEEIQEFPMVQFRSPPRKLLTNPKMYELLDGSA